MAECHIEGGRPAVGDRHCVGQEVVEQCLDLRVRRADVAPNGVAHVGDRTEGASGGTERQDRSLCIP
jgi:hypothetical protein